MYDFFYYIYSMNEIKNPFPVSGYYGAALFCDREEETKRLVTNVRNGINTTLLSIRRMGKTGLIWHVFETLKKDKKIRCIYIDIYATQSLKDFTNQLAAGILKAFPEKQNLGKKFMNVLKGFRPIISFDGLTGEPEVSFDFSTPKQNEQSLAGVFSFLETQDVRIVIAIDEFQQVVLYPEKNTEALLRTLIQPLKNVQFIFSGSNKHMLSDIFSNSKRPFFSSTQPLYLAPIPERIYLSFIAELFKKHKRKIQEDALTFIGNWTRLHTYYTQVICNKIYSTEIKDITLAVVQHTCSELLNEQATVFLQYRNLLTTVQWNLLKAIAKEDKVYQPSAKSFIAKNEIGTPANVQRALEALMNKEMIYRERDEKGNYYRVYDCFLSRWLEKH
jgi:AAA+ ATPase superfamily predicted ATPase